MFWRSLEMSEAWAALRPMMYMCGDLAMVLRANSRAVKREMPLVPPTNTATRFAARFFWCSRLCARTLARVTIVAPRKLLSFTDGENITRGSVIPDVTPEKDQIYLSHSLIRSLSGAEPATVLTAKSERASRGLGRLSLQSRPRRRYHTRTRLAIGDFTWHSTPLQPSTTYTCMWCMM